MNCYDCNMSDRTTPAVAICHDCGAGICPDHANEVSHHLTKTVALSRRVRVEPPERWILCATCSAAETAAASG